MKTRHLALLFVALLPIGAWADVWQDPETKVNYEYTPGSGEASVAEGEYYNSAGSPDATGDIAILSSFTVDGKEYSVTSIGDYAFQSCKGLTSVTIPNTVTSIGWMAFFCCSSLTSITIPNSVTSIGDHAFEYCSSLTSVTIGNSVTSIGQMAFRFCSSLTSVTIPNSVTSIESDTFYGCSSLTSVTIPNSVTRIRGSAFQDCSSLTSVTIPNSVTSIGHWAFQGCSGLTAIKVEEGNTVYDSRDNCNAIIKTEANELILGCKNTIIPNSVTSIGDYAFQSCKGLTSVTIPNSVTSIGYWAFYGCSGLTAIKVEEGNTLYDSRDNCNAIIKTETNELITGCKNTIIPNSVTSIGNSAFRGCSSLTTVTIPNSVTSIGGSAFYGCSGLTSVTIPNSVTSIGDEAFMNCRGLTELKVEEGNTVYDSRNNCNAIIKTETNELITGCKNTIIPNSVVSIGDYAFYGCDGLASIIIPNSVVSIGYWAFGWCEELTSVTLSNSLTSIGELAFQACFMLKSINIPNSVTSIGNSAFRGCSSLTTVTIPNSVTSIGYRAFYSCLNLAEVRSLIMEPFAIGNDVFEYYGDDGYLYTSATSATLYVPIGTKEKYEATEGWKEFTNIVETDGLEAEEDGEKNYGNDGDITEDTDLSGTVVDNMFYNIGTDAGGYNSEEGCIVITKETSDEQMELLQGLGISDEELQKNFTGIIFKVPAGKGKVKVTAETTGNMTLKVKVGNGQPLEMEIEGNMRMKMNVPYDVNEESLVYIFAGTTGESGVRGTAEPASLKIYGIEWASAGIKGDLNGDGVVDVGDIMAIINIMASPSGSPQGGMNGDLNGDGNVDVGDIMAIINIMAGQ